MAQPSNRLPTSGETHTQTPAPSTSSNRSPAKPSIEAPQPAKPICSWAPTPDSPATPKSSAGANPPFSWGVWDEEPEDSDAFKANCRKTYDLNQYPWEKDYKPPANKSRMEQDEERGYADGSNWRRVRYAPADDETPSTSVASGSTGRKSPAPSTVATSDDEAQAQDQAK